ncbi:MAG TPA: GGDEF domain-containing protein [Pirellulaceae bacterium]|nr:GGDEF domain-containing protein [Pirellulaceae bacterium]
MTTPPPAHPASDSLASLAQRGIPTLLISTSPARMLAWRQALVGERFQLSEQATDFTAHSPPLVILTDQSLAAAELATFHPLMVQGEIGVVLWGRDLPADVALPDDASPRELRLTCKLLAQVVALRRQQRHLLTLAATDPLTGLPNRRALEEQFPQRQAEAARESKALALAIFDLDQFKAVNAEFGFACGDEVLRKVSQTLLARAGENFVARLGGDELICLTVTAQRDMALGQFEALRRALGMAASLTLERPLSASAGVAFASSGTTLSALLASADQALRIAKQQGGKRVMVAEAS